MSDKYGISRGKQMKLITALLLSSILVQSAVGTDGKSATKGSALGGEQEISQYTFAWPFLKKGKMTPRGGTTQGPPVVTTNNHSAMWTELRESQITKFERDRRAILAMQGEYRASFDFIETTVFKQPYVASKPYQSWGTEFVSLIADTGNFISLQHILVIQAVTADGTLTAPMVMKHWRQDWQYEDRSLMVYIGNNSWEPKEVDHKAAKGRWSQAVFQVDDSPRYEARGEWRHKANYSSWISDETWRPIPRRESSIRTDYHVLVGTNRHTITPTGWTHQENNLKVVLNDAGLITENGVIAEELGFNRYERITGYDFSAGVEYWSATSVFWAEVREAWHDTYSQGKTLKIKPVVDGKVLFGEMFLLADSVLEEKEPFDAKKIRLQINETLEKFLDY